MTSRRNIILGTCALLISCADDPGQSVVRSAEPRAPRGAGSSEAGQEEARLSMRVPQENRLYFPALDDRGHFHGKLRANDRTDILAVKPKSAEEPAMVTTLLQNVPLARADKGDQESPGRVGLIVSVEEVMLLESARHSMNLVLLPRHPEDSEVFTIRKQTLREALEDVEITQEHRNIRNRKWNRSTSIVAKDRLTNAIRPEERAFALSTQIPPNSVRAGDAVDLFATAELPELGATTTNLLQEIWVLDVVPTPEGSDLVLSVSLEEAELLALLGVAGEVSAAVRHPEDRKLSNLTRKTLREVLDDLEVIQEKRQIRLRKTARKKASPAIEIIRGDAGPMGMVQDLAGSEAFTDYGVNGFVATKDDHLSTFSIDVDTGSYTIARRHILETKTLPPGNAVRVEEFVNYFDYDYPEPETGAFAVSMEAAPSPFSAERNLHLLRVGVKGKVFRERERKPLHLTFLVDISGSMRGPDRLPLAQSSLRVLVDHLQDEDTVALVTYAGSTGVVLGPTPASRRAAILAAIDGLSAGGGTAMESGMTLAYQQASQSFVKGHENRVIVLSDGDANIGRTDWQTVLSGIEGYAEKGITMSTIGFGMGNYKDTMMEQLADNGDGNYFYIDTFDEAARLFGENFDGTTQVIAKDVKIQVEFNPDAVRRYRLVGYENRDIADEDFRNDAVDAGEIGAGHAVTALYEVELVDDLPETIATVRVRHKEPRGSRATEQTFALEDWAVFDQLDDASPDFRFAAAVAAFAEKLRRSPHSEGYTLDWILEVAVRAVNQRQSRAEFVSLVRSAKAQWTEETHE